MSLWISKRRSLIETRSRHPYPPEQHKIQIPEFASNLGNA
jgi:hypothetical protein